MLKMPVSLYRLLMAVQLTIQGNWFSTLVYSLECMPLPAWQQAHHDVTSILNQSIDHIPFTFSID